MIRSMTGFGKGKVGLGNTQVRVELKTFNHKFFEISYKLPDNLQQLEEQIKKTIRKKIKRGKLYLWVNIEQTNDKSQDIKIDEKKLKRYLFLLKSIKRRFNLKDNVTLNQLLSFPDVIIYQPKKEKQNILFKSTTKALNIALANLYKMREKEGRALYKDLLQRCRNIDKSLKRISSFLPQEVDRYRKKLKKKVNGQKDANGLRRERIEVEVALFARNCDVTEELTRLSAHINNFKGTLRNSREAGKILDFIAQELHREINTVGAKSSDFRISKEVISVKGEVEKIREQVQNIE